MKKFKIKWYSVDVNINDVEIISANTEQEAIEKLKKHRSITFDINNDIWTIEEVN